MVVGGDFHDDVFEFLRLGGGSRRSRLFYHHHFVMLRVVALIRLELSSELVTGLTLQYSVYQPKGTHPDEIHSHPKLSTVRSYQVLYR